MCQHKVYSNIRNLNLKIKKYFLSPKNFKAEKKNIFFFIPVRLLILLQVDFKKYHDG